MYILKGKTGEIIAISDTLDYQLNGNPLIDNGARAIAEVLVGSVEESDTIPEGWEYLDGVYSEIAEEVDNASAEERITSLESQLEITQQVLDAILMGDITL